MRGTYVVNLARVLLTEEELRRCNYFQGRRIAVRRRNALLYRWRIRMPRALRVFLITRGASVEWR